MYNRRTEGLLLRGCCGMIQGNEFPGIAELVPRHIWDVEIVRSSRTTRTKMKRGRFSSFLSKNGPVLLYDKIFVLIRTRACLYNRLCHSANTLRLMICAFIHAKNDRPPAAACQRILARKEGFELSEACKSIYAAVRLVPTPQGFPGFGV